MQMLKNKMLQEAMEIFEMTLILARRTQNLALESASHSGLAVSKAQLMKFYESLEHSKETLRISMQTENLSAQRIALTNMGNAYLELKQFDLSKSCYFDALQRAEQGNDPEGQVDVHLNLAIFYRSLGRSDEALKCCESGLKIVDNFENAVPQWKAGAELRLRIQIGRLYRDLDLRGSTSRNHAAEQFDAAHRLATVAGDMDAANRAAFLKARSNADRTTQIALARAALAEAEAAGAAAAIASACVDLAGSYFVNHDLFEALPLYERALTFFGSPGLTVQKPPLHVLNCIGTIHLMTGRDTAAAVVLERAVTLYGQEDQSAALGDEDRVALSEQCAAAFELLQRAYLRMDRPAEALLAVDRGRAQVLTYNLHHQATTSVHLGASAAASSHASAVADVPGNRDGLPATGADFGACAASVDGAEQAEFKNLESLETYVRGENVTTVLFAILSYFSCYECSFLPRN
jgi:tetratricopeptide (TPR) repeat protein